MSVREYSVVGKRQKKIEAFQKATGRMRYCGDLSAPGMLHCGILRSPHANAMVRRVDRSRALEVPGVVDIITHEDVPKILSMHQFLHVPEIMYYDSYILERHVRHVGDRVAAVAAETPEAVEEALRLIDVDYEVLPAAVDMDDAMAPEAPQIHEEAKKGDKPVELRGNIFDEVHVDIGDVEQGFGEADLVIERTYGTSKPNPAPMERTAVLCVPGPDGKLDVWGTTQGIHAMRMNMGNTLGVPVSKINCHRVFLGGAFGAHIHTGFIENICALLALRTGKPVRGEKTREEMFLSCGRHPMKVTLKAGFKRDGTLLALHSDTTDDTGSYAFSGSSKMMLTAGFTLSMYRCENLRMTGRSVYTNTPPLTAMRGAGNPQASWAVESLMDEVAETLQIDPIELRLHNNLGVGDLFYGQGPAVISTIRSCGTEELLREGAKRIGWHDRGNNRIPYPDRPWIRRGIGMARGFHTSGCGSEKPNEFIIDFSGAFIKMNEDGTAQIMNSAADCGGGNLSTHASLVAEIIGLDYEDVIVNDGDTDTTPFDGVTHASRGLYGSGQPVARCAEQIRQQLLEWGARHFQCGPEDVEISGSRIYPFREPDRSMSVAQVVAHGQARGWGNVTAHSAIRPQACPPHFVVIFLEVEVDTLTGKVQVTRAFSGADVGTVINRNNVEGQIAGGLHMGLGYGLMEDTLFDRETGRPLNANLADYKMLTSLDMPDVEMYIADTYEPTGPLGSKGIGEGVTNPVAPAVGSAIYDACGVRIRDLPCSPEKIRTAIRQAGGSR
ncbi:MAG: xanthine dehydrogenase family protein molybdopterin-binding subunit [Synergistales bacterium]|nr:xanthine dehydrogenase family protein molybdopterin-binding subunit [Synergistales bacterium]